MGESVFSLRKKPPAYKGLPAFCSASRRFSSLVRPPCARADCASRVLPLQAWASRGGSLSRLPRRLPFFRPRGSFFLHFSFRRSLRHALAQACPRSGTGAPGMTCRSLRRKDAYVCSCLVFPRRQDALKGARDSPNFGCPELSGETAPDAEVVCPAKTAPCASLIGAASSFCSDRRGLPSGLMFRLPCRRVPSRCIRLRRSLAACRAWYLWRPPPVASASDGPLPHRLSPR